MIQKMQKCSFVKSHAVKYFTYDHMLNFPINIEL